MKKPEQVVDDGALRAVEPGLVAGHRQVLARESGGDHIGIGRQGPEVRNVGVTRDIRESPLEHDGGMRVVVTE